ncbi:MAG: HAD family hydrolase [Mycobacterium sp.]
MHITPTQAPRQFWWDRARPVDADVSPLRAAIFDLDALADAEGEPRAGLADLVMSLFVAGVWVGVVSPERRDRVQPLVRQLLGDGIVETVVTGDDVTDMASDAETYRLALWELGLTAESALAVVGSGRGLRAAVAAGLPAVVVSTDDTAGTGAVAVRACYDGLLVEDCRQLVRWWWVAQRRSELLASA